MPVDQTTKAMLSSKAYVTTTTVGGVCGGGVVVCGGVWRWCSGVWRGVEVV